MLFFFLVCRRTLWVGTSTIVYHGVGVVIIMTADLSFSLSETLGRRIFGSSFTFLFPCWWRVRIQGVEYTGEKEREDKKKLYGRHWQIGEVRLISLGWLYSFIFLSMSLAFLFL